MSRRKKINKFKVSIIIIIVIMFLMTVTGFGRFFYNTVKDRYLSSKKFYFTSDLLTTSENSIEYKNWDGNGIYEIDFNLFSQNNELEQYTEDLNYSVIIGYNDSNILCALNPNQFKESTGGTVADNYDNVGTISVTTHKDVLKLYVKPNVDELTGEEKSLTVNTNNEIKIKVYTTSPYRKTLSAKINLKIASLSYEILKNTRESDVILRINNNYDYDSDIIVDFNESYLKLDLNDSVYIEDKNRATVNNNGLVTSITFPLPAESSRDIRFYKGSDDNPDITTWYFTKIDRVKKE